MNGSSVKIEKFVFDYFEHINKDSDMKKSKQIYDILMNCFYNSENKILDKTEDKIYFTNEQLSDIRRKQKELGYEDNFNRFARYALFEFFIRENNIALSDNSTIELIDCNKFSLLSDKCKYDLLKGKYTSYDIDLLRNNKEYENKISFDVFNEAMKLEPFDIDFLEYDMIQFLYNNFEKEKTYSEMEGLSTNQFSSDFFVGELEPFVDYDNIVPNKDSFYYLLVYYILIDYIEESKFEKIFAETDEHIKHLLEKYTFEKITNYYKRKYNIDDFYRIFDEKCMKYLKSNGLIVSSEDMKLDETIEFNNIQEEL